MIGGTLASVSGLLGLAAGAIGVFAPKRVTRGTVLRLVCFAMFTLAILIGAFAVWIGWTEAQAAQEQMDRIEEYLRELDKHKQDGALAALGIGAIAAGGGAATKPSPWFWALFAALLWTGICVAYLVLVERPWG